MDILQVAYKTVLKKMPVGVIILDSIEQILEINPVAERLLSISDNQATGRDISSLLSDWKGMKRHFVSKEGSYTFRSRIDDEEEVYEVSCVPLEGHESGKAGSVFLFSLITGRSDTGEENLQMTTPLLTLINTLPGYAYYKDELGNYLTANKPFCELFQVPDDIKGKKDLDLLPEGIRQILHGLDSAVLSGCLDQGECETKISGSPGDIVVSWRIVPTRDGGGNITGVIGLGYDVSFRSAGEADLKECMGIIETRNAELIRLHDDLTEMNRNLDQQVMERTREVEALLVQKDHFIWQLAHDLRSPLIPLVGLIPFLIEQEKDPDIVRLLSQMKSSITVMQHTVEQIINLARLNSMYYITDQKSYDLAELVESVVNEYIEEARNRSIDITVDIMEGIPVSLSPVHAHDILRHLVSNAIRFNNPGGFVHIGAGITDNSITIIVQDSGIGIEEAEIPRIFEEFYRADRSRKNIEAKGLGLAMVRKMVVLEEGKVWAESEGPGTGSTFYVRLPRGDHQTWLVS